MTNSNVSRIGQVNGSGDVDSLFLKVFAGEVLTAFGRTNVMMDKHFVRTISSGKSAQFPSVGRIGARYHTPGEEILGQKVNHAESVITIDNVLIADAFIANIDEAKTHYDVRSTYSSEVGRALAKQMDKHVLQTLAKTARLANPVADLPGGSVISGIDATQVDNLIDALWAAAQKLDEKDVPEEERYVVVRPEQYYQLAQSTKLLNRDWGGRGVYAEGTVFKVAGITIVKSNNLPSTNIADGTVGAGTENRYGGDFTKCLGVVFQKSAVGTVKLLDLAMEQEYLIEKQGTLILGKYAVGHGGLRPDCAIELTASAAVTPPAGG